MQKIIYLTALLILLPAGNAGAIGLNFLCVSSNADAACQLGEEQLSLEVLSDGNKGIDLFFRNTDSNPADMDRIDPAISEVYIDSNLFLTTTPPNPNPWEMFNLITVSTPLSPGVSFNKALAGPGPRRLNPGNLPGAPKSFVADFGAQANGANRNGVQEGEFLRMNISTLSFDTFFRALNGEQGKNFDIGLHVRAFADGASASFIATGALPAVSPVPVPAAFWLFGTALIGFISISRRRSI